MYIIGENIHILSDKVKEALKERDSEFFMELAQNVAKQTPQTYFNQKVLTWLGF